jgi:hypothetical protein
LASIIGPAQSQFVRTGLLVPLYVYPAHGSWQPLIAAKQASPEVPVLAIVNPASGPGKRTDPNYVNGISALRAVSVLTLGYVPTLYGKRSYEEVTNDIDAYSKLYGRTFDGIFIDEMAKTDVVYYKNIKSYAKQKDFSRVIGNPGTDIPEGYIGEAADVFVIYENAGNPSITFLDGWHSAYAKQTWGFIAHHVPALDVSLIARAKDQVGLLYLTDANYHAFPPYLEQLFALLTA